ncbi:MAG: hypothetical protein IPH78_09115 [Bacteroidetes bacterium]|nr:hypothetical protein [Bacteroidota bacterium]
MDELYKKEVRCFVSTQDLPMEAYPEALFIRVAPGCAGSAKTGGQSPQIVFVSPSIAITGSNGKTVVKEWLYQLLLKTTTLVRSPKASTRRWSLSLWNTNAEKQSGHFLKPAFGADEVVRLEKIIRPTLAFHQHRRSA